jgi:diguanylate cyclase (GGDEF)-like protein
VNRYGGILGVIFFSLDKRSGERDETWDELVIKMAKNMRAYDVFGRWNNSEHAVLVPQRALSQVTGFAVRLRRFVDEYHLNGLHPFSASLGVTEYRRGEAVHLFLQRAQCAMDRAKAAGGNRISAARTDR